MKELFKNSKSTFYIKNFKNLQSLKIAETPMEDSLTKNKIVELLLRGQLKNSNGYSEQPFTKVKGF